MTSEELELFRVNAIRFYTNKDINPNIPEISDQEYDRLEKLYGKRGLSLVEFPETKIPNNHIEPRLEKSAVGSSDFRGDAIKKLKKLNESYIINYKYDGSAIRAEYKSGRLYKIISTPDEPECLDVTEKFCDLFPDKIDPEITYVRAELIVDPSIDGFGQKARNKANGLIISKYLEDEIKKYARLRVYNLEFKDEEYNYKRLIDNLNKFPENEYLKVAERLLLSEIPDKPVLVSPSGDSVLIDGIVVYTESKKFAIKFYFTDIQLTEIKDIEWNYNEKNGGYTPTYIIKDVILNEKRIKKVSTGGVANMMKNGGIGTKTYVILSKMTIPQIYTDNTYVPERIDGNYGNHVCECGTEMDLVDDRYGSNLRCPNVECSLRIQSKQNRFDDSLGWEYNLNEVLGIDRFKVTELSQELIDELNSLRDYYTKERVEKFEEFMLKHFKLTDLQKQLLKLNSYSFCLCF